MTELVWLVTGCSSGYVFPFHREFDATSIAGALQRITVQDELSSIRVIPLTLSGNSFGEAFVHSILARGDKVIATGRNAESRLAHLKGTGAAILDLDVTSPQEILDSKIQEAIAIYGKIDVLINNAAYGELAFLEEME
jgi:NADP-dependent 3-hydroxy acid dehydrogenase YdfG